MHVQYIQFQKAGTFTQPQYCSIISVTVRGSDVADPLWPVKHLSMEIMVLFSSAALSDTSC